MTALHALRAVLFSNYLLLSSIAVAQEAMTTADEIVTERSRWVCVVNLKRGTVTGHGDTMEEARASVLRRCAPDSTCLAHMRCWERAPGL